MITFPITVSTRAGGEVTLTGYYDGYDRPWVGFIEVDLVDAKFPWAASWLPSGHYLNDETDRSLDLVNLPVNESTSPIDGPK